MEPCILNIVLPLHTAKSIVWHLYMFNQIRIDAFLDSFQLGFGGIDYPRPVFAISGYILRFVLALISKFVRLIALELIVKLCYMFYNKTHTLFRLSKNQLAEYVIFLNKHEKK